MVAELRPETASVTPEYQLEELFITALERSYRWGASTVDSTVPLDWLAVNNNRAESDPLAIYPMSTRLCWRQHTLTSSDKLRDSPLVLRLDPASLAALAGRLSSTLSIDIEHLVRWHRYSLPEARSFQSRITQRQLPSILQNQPQEQHPEGQFTRQRFLGNLLQSFELEALEDGYEHPAESLMEEALRANSPNATGWIAEAFYTTLERRPSTAANILQSLGRLPRELVSKWGMWLASSALAEDDIELRDAGVRALERWGGQDAIAILQGHLATERVPWLARYMRQVITDLSK